MAASGAVLVKACLNGCRSRAEHEAVPVTPQELARDARAVVAEGAAALHVHPRDAHGTETLDAAACGAAITAMREACPGIPVGLSTAAWIAPDLRARVRLIESWTVLPDFASVNFSEAGAAEICAALTERGIGIEAGLWSVDDVTTFVASRVAAHGLRVLVEALPKDPHEAVAAAAAIDAALDRAEIRLPRLHHGDGFATWAVLESALDLLRDVRVGLEDTLELPDGRRARDNRELIEAAVGMVRRHGHRPALAAGD